MPPRGHEFNVSLSSPAHYWSVWTLLQLFLQPSEQPWQPQAPRAPSEVAPGLHSPVSQQHTRASTGCCPEDWGELSQGHSWTQEFSGGYFLVVGSRVLQHIKCYCPLLQGPAALPDSHLPHLQPNWSNMAKHFYSSKANLVSVPKPAWCLPAFSFVNFSKFKLEESTAQPPEITQWEHE